MLEPRAPYPSEDPRGIVEYNTMRAADRLGLDSEMRILLNMSSREARVELPVCTDDGSLRVVGYCVEHSGVPVRPRVAFAVILQRV